MKQRKDEEGNMYLLYFSRNFILQNVSEMVINFIDIRFIDIIEIIYVWSYIDRIVHLNLKLKKYDLISSFFLSILLSDCNLINLYAI